MIHIAIQKKYIQFIMTIIINSFVGLPIAWTKPYKPIIGAQVL
jgi:hypothetical protein